MTPKLTEACTILQDKGYDAVGFSNDDADKAVVLCEAIGLLAKQNERDGYLKAMRKCYDLRTGCIIEAIKIHGVAATWGTAIDPDTGTDIKDIVYYLSSPEAGIASFHSRNNLLDRHITNHHGREWSGILRQDYAFTALKYPAFRVLLNKELEYDGNGNVSDAARNALQTELNDFHNKVNKS